MDKGEFFQSRDRFLHYDFEDALFFWDHRAGSVRMKFVGQDYDIEVPTDQRLFNDAIRHGREVTRDEYEAGRPAGRN